MKPVENTLCDLHYDCESGDYQQRVTYLLRCLGLKSKGDIFVSLRMLYLIWGGRFNRPLLLPSPMYTWEENRRRSLVLLRLDKLRDACLEPLPLVRCRPAPFSHCVVGRKIFPHYACNVFVKSNHAMFIYLKIV